MNGNGLATLETNEGTNSTTVPGRKPRFSGVAAIAFGISCYMIFAALYFSKANKPIIIFGQLHFTIDAFLEILFTSLSLPGFFLIYLYGIKNYAENPGFAVPELAIDFLLVGSIAWIALGNGIHLASKLSEQMISGINGKQGLSCKANIHYLRQVVGHIFPHIGWQMLFATLMLGQIKRPYHGRKSLQKTLPFLGALFGLLFAHGAISGNSSAVGFVLTLMSCLIFSYLAHRLGCPSDEIPVIKFFLSSQITFLVVILMYWLVSRLSS
jgi:hypothetical protein